MFIINLKDKKLRFEKVRKQFDKLNIKYTRFNAIDGRCKTEKQCETKLHTFVKKYKVNIENVEGFSLKKLLPVTSLTLGTFLILKNMIKNKWENVLICEDDIVLDKDFLEIFARGVNSIYNDTDNDWDLLYLGCGNRCGKRGITYKQTKTNKHPSTIMHFSDINAWVKNKDDLRMPCPRCYNITKYISQVENPGGAWCYAYSLKGAIKMFNMLKKNVGNHIDQILEDSVEKGKLKAIAFDPPIAWHEKGAFRPDSDIPWEW